MRTRQGWMLVKSYDHHAVGRRRPAVLMSIQINRRRIGPGVVARQHYFSLRGGASNRALSESEFYERQRYHPNRR